MIIKIRNIRHDIDIDETIGKKIRELWMDNPRSDQVVSAGGHSFKLRDIERFTKDKKAVTQNRPIEQTNREYQEHRQAFVKQEPHIKAKNLSTFSLMWRSFTGKVEIPSHVQKRVIEIQRQFFIENPKRLYADPILFQDVIKPFEIKQKLMANAVVGLIENIIGTDLRESKFS